MSFYRTYRGLIVGTMVALIGLGAEAQMVPQPMDTLSFDGPNPANRFRDIGIDQNLGAQVPLNLLFTDSRGNEVELAEYMTDRPAILALVYYECPMLCILELDSIEILLDAMKFQVGTDFDVITVSIDPRETPALAAEKKANHIERLRVEGGERGWHFLTGTEDQIEVLADTVGFRYVYDEGTNQYAHAAGIMVLTPTGEIARYYYGLDYIPRDVEFGLTEASAGKIGNVVDQIVLLCFQYDPATGKYGFYVIGAMRVMATMMILGLATMYTVLYLKMRKKKKAEGATPSGMTDTNAGAAR